VSEWSGVPVLITGGTGFVGGALTRRLLAKGAAVTVLARNAAKAAPLAELGVTVVHGDLLHAEAVRTATHGAAVVFHIAALLGGTLAAQWRINVDGTRGLLQAALLAGARRFVHVSSIAVYGNLLPVRVAEDAPLAPGASPYGISKAQADRLVVRFGAEHGLPVSIVRPGMIFGPGSHMWTANIYRLARLRPTPFLGDGAMPVPAVYIDDLVDLLLRAGRDSAAVGHAFNAVADPAPTWREYIGAFSALAGHDQWLAIPPLVGRIAGGVAMLAAPRDSVVRDLPDMLERVIGPASFSAEKAKMLLGWQAATPVGEGVQRSAVWLREAGLL
jgi:nucleoside-diphosphate-sugar epimerase